MKEFMVAYIYKRDGEVKKIHPIGEEIKVKQQRLHTMTQDKEHYTILKVWEVKEVK